MRVLLDECLPKRLAKAIAGHEVRTVADISWSGKKNGELLNLMSASEFQVFLTGDQNLRYQQNLVSANVAVIVLCGASNRLADLQLLIPPLLLTLETIQKGELLELRAQNSEVREQQH
jgi:predicted nuclease of predicted toxin-antitoxin system